MKSLTKHIAESLRIGINKCIPVMNESLRIGINDNPYSASPTTWDELRQIIEDRYEKLGPGTAKEPIYFGDINVSEMTTFYDGVGLFQNTKFEYIDVSNWDTSNVKDMHRMFEKCINLKSVGDLSNWDVSQVENICLMFRNCSKLEFIGDLSNWNISKVEYTYGMFDYCEKLESIGDLSDWNTSKVEDMSNMFFNCKNLKSVGDLNKWDVYGGCIIRNMFTNSGIKNIPTNWYKI